MSSTRVHPQDLASEREPEPTEAIDVPLGTRFYDMVVTAETWEAWDQLRSDFEIREWWVEPDGVKSCAPEVDGARLHSQLERKHGTGKIIVFPPHKPRETVTVDANGIPF